MAAQYTFNNESVHGQIYRLCRSTKLIIIMNYTVNSKMFLKHVNEIINYT